MNLEQIIMDDELTLQKIFNIVEKDLEFWNVFCGADCGDLIRELNQTPTESYDLKMLVLAPEYEVESDVNEYKVYRLTGRFELDGILNDNTKCSLDFLSIQNLKSLPIKIITDVSIPLQNKKDKLIVVPTLCQLIYDIVWELTFYGNTKERDTAGEDILKD